jgi:hypothetical protein
MRIGHKDRKEINMSLIGKIIHAFNERGAARLSLIEIKGKLAQSEVVITERILKAADTPKNRNLASHLIGIERWAQKRLRVALGELLVIEEYDAYRPGTALAMEELSKTFQSTRQATLNLVDELEQAKVDVTTLIPHNELGTLTVKGWLFYLVSHGLRESQGIK